MSPSWWLWLSWTEPVTWMSLHCFEAPGCCHWHHLSLTRGGERWSARPGQGPGRGRQGPGAGSGTCPSSRPPGAHSPPGFIAYRARKNRDLDNILPPGLGGGWQRDMCHPSPHSTHRAPSGPGCEGAFAHSSICRAVPAVALSTKVLFAQEEERVQPSPTGITKAKCPTAEPAPSASTRGDQRAGCWGPQFRPFPPSAICRVGCEARAKHPPLGASFCAKMDEPRRHLWVQGGLLGSQAGSRGTTTCMVHGSTGLGADDPRNAEVVLELPEHPRHRKHQPAQPVWRHWGCRLSQGAAGYGRGRVLPPAWGAHGGTVPNHLLGPPGSGRSPSPCHGSPAAAGRAGCGPAASPGARLSRPGLPRYSPPPRCPVAPAPTEPVSAKRGGAPAPPRCPGALRARRCRAERGGGTLRAPSPVQPGSTEIPPPVLRGAQPPSAPTPDPPETRGAPRPPASPGAAVPAASSAEAQQSSSSSSSSEPRAMPPPPPRDPPPLPPLLSRPGEAGDTPPPPRCAPCRPRASPQPRDPPGGSSSTSPPGLSVPPRCPPAPGP